MKQSFRVNLSATAVQLCINQAFGLLVFYFASKGLSKDAFGELNWILAVFLTVFAVLSFGIDQIIIKKIADGESASCMLALHLFHVVLTGILFYALLVLLYFLLPFVFTKHPLLLLLGAGKLLLFFSTPFKSLASGAEQFRRVLYMSVSSSVLKGLCLGLLFFVTKLSFPLVVFVFVAADASELFFCCYLVWKSPDISVRIFSCWKDYSVLLKEAAPQIGVVLFSSALARIDWILIGIFLPASKLAEYSFAYKAFELSTMPLLAIAPLLIPYFTRVIKNNKLVEQQSNVRLLLRSEMIIACFVALCLNLLWNPLVDRITDGKYGSVNAHTLFILSLTLPVLYLNNFLWSMHFAYGHTKIILRSFALCFVVNTVANLVLVPLFQNEGAAFSYLFALVVQTVFYLVYSKWKSTTGWQSLLFCVACALCSGAAVKYMPLQVWWSLPLCAALYVLLLLCTVQLRQADWRVFKQVLRT